jgi:hypothetical protein
MEASCYAPLTILKSALLCQPKYIPQGNEENHKKFEAAHSAYGLMSSFHVLSDHSHAMVKTS